MTGFVLETNARSSSAFPHPTDDPDEKLRGAFARMDGDRLFAFLLWELPPNRSFDDGLHGLEPQEFIQCAGAADALTVELRERDDSGSYVSSTLGRAEEQAGPQDEVIEWCGNTKEVHRNERWISGDAADLFLTYWRTRSLPDNISKRPLEPFDD